MQESNNEECMAIQINSDCIIVLDQKLLPNQIQYIKINTIEQGWKSIRDMNVRGAPLISVVATQSLKIELQQTKFENQEALQQFITEKIAYLRSSRPTAVNLFNDTQEILILLESLNGKNLEDQIQLIINQIDKFQQDYKQAYIDMSQKACDQLIIDCQSKNKEKLNILTICNTGKLATGGDGTALGVVRELHRRGKLNQLYIPETRPYNQGFRLTAFEALKDNIPATLITDSMVGYLMQVKGIDAVLVGADRVAKNGDTANKIGTYTFAISAQYHQIPFYVILPHSTLDLNCESGKNIVVEERDQREVIFLDNKQLAPLNLNVWNPSFDVTPSSLISRIFTEKGEYQFK